MHLDADNDINLLASRNASEQHSTNASSGSSVGVSLAPGSVTPTASYNRGRGHADGEDITWTETRISATHQLTIDSGNDTTLRGAIAEANQIVTDIGGDLHIESQQDTSTYRDSQRGYGISLNGGSSDSSNANSDITDGGIGLNVTRQQVESTYASVNEQSGLYAGDGGFQINVQGHTQLDGAVITSSQIAIDEGRNTFTTGTLATTDIHNHSDFEAQSLGLGLNYSNETDRQGNQSGYHGFNAQVPIVMNAEDSDASITRSGISQAAVTFTGNDEQNTQSEQQLASIDRSLVTGDDTSGHIENLYNEDTQAQIDARFQITQTLIQETNSFLAHRARETDQAEQELERQQARPEQLRDETRIAQALETIEANQTWQMGGTGRILLTALGGAASSNVMGSTQQFLQSATVNVIQSYATQEIKDWVDNHLEEGALRETTRAALHGILACTGATAQNADCGSAALGASASVIISNLIAAAEDDDLTEEERQAVSNIVGNIVGAVSTALGDDAQIATLAARIESENNSLLNSRAAVSRCVAENLSLRYCGGERLAELIVEDFEQNERIRELVKENLENEVVGMYEQAVKLPDTVATIIQNPELLGQILEQLPEATKKAVIQLVTQFYADLGSHAQGTFSTTEEAYESQAQAEARLIATMIGIVVGAGVTKIAVKGGLVVIRGLRGNRRDGPESDKPENEKPENDEPDKDRPEDESDQEYSQDRNDDTSSDTMPERETVTDSNASRLGKNPQFFKTETTWKASGNGTGNTYKVYQQEIDWGLEVKPGVTNLDLAKAGRSPFIKKDGKLEQIQLHHSQQNANGPLFELSRKSHLDTKSGQGREAVHPYGNQPNPDFPVDRTLFKKEVPQ